MGASVKYLHRHPKTGRLSFRRAYPPDLRPHIPGQLVELKRSLEAKMITAPGALDRFRDAAAEYEREARKARKAATGTFDRLDEPMIAYLAALHGQGLHLGSAEVKDIDAQLKGWDWLLDDFKKWRGEGDADEAVPFWGPHAQRLLDAQGLVLDPDDTASFGELCLALNNAAVAASADAMTRLRHGDQIAIPPDPVRPTGGGSPAASTTEGLSFDGVVELILDSPVHKLSETTKETTRTALRYFREAFENIAPKSITRKVVTEWLNLLVQKPRDPRPGDRRLKLPDLVKRYEGEQDVRRLSGKTVEQYVTALSARWRQAVKDGLIEEGLSNAFSDRKVPQGPRPEKKVQFSREELRAIFSLPIFTRGEAPLGGKGAASYWMPLLLLWTGARPEEIAQLVVADVFNDPDSNRWVLRITDAGTHPHKGQRLLKTSGSNSGRRTFPLPQALLDLNFLGYVDHVRSSGEQALFPQLRPKGKRNYLHAQWATWWGKHLRSAGILPPVSINSRKPVREFRDVWATAARASGLYRETMEYVMGHTPPNKTANEDYGDKDPLGRQIDMLSFAGLDMSQVMPWKPRIRAAE